jgi:hypothetical protein
MKSNHSRRIRVTRILLGAAIVFALFLAREAKAGDEEDHQPLVTDWSHRHLMYSEPHSQMKRFQLSAETRYVQQVKRKNAERRGIGRDEWRWHHAPQNPHSLEGDWSMDMGAGATLGAGNYPAKYSFDTTSANCASATQPDFVVYNTSLAGTTGSQATIVAFDNLYSSCAGGTPLTYWAYNTGPAGTAALTSPVLSFDGQQVAFVQSTAGSTTGAATLVILRWKASTGTLASPVAPPAGPCTALTAPCQITVSFSTAGGADTNTADNFSSPFYDYAQDVLYVGDNAGFLHKFTGVFLGTPTEVVSSGSAVWPVNLTTGFGHLNSPVFVQSSKGVIVNEVLVTDNGGLLYAVDATKGGVDNTTFNNLDPKLADPGFEDAPVVDATTGKVFLFARASSEFITPSDPPFHGTPGIPSIFQVDIPTTPVNIHFEPYIQAIIGDNYSSGTATISTLPIAGDTITIGPTSSFGPAPTIYKFVTTLVSANDVLIVAGSTADTALNLQAAINANSGQCFSAPCFGTGTTANTGVTAGAATTVVTVTPTSVAGSGIALATTSGGRITLSSSTGTLAPPIPSAMYDGAFDDVYNTSGNGSGFLYACGTHSVGASAFNAIWYTAVDTGVIDTATILVPTISTAMSTCSPITEFSNGGSDRIFLSVAGSPVTAAPISCPSAATGCIMSFSIDTFLTTGSGTAARASEAGGTSGIVVDNSSAAGGASQVYFTPLSDQPCAGSGGVGTGTGGCAIQASQSGLL